jgi:hypothetical protein
MVCLPRGRVLPAWRKSLWTKQMAVLGRTRGGAVHRSRVGAEWSSHMIGPKLWISAEKKPWKWR